jgi:integration host factor subunit beta
MSHTGKTITKKDLIDRIAHANEHITRSDVKDVVQAFLDAMIDELGSGNRLEFRDFGVFEVKKRAARTAQNPQTGQPVRVPPKRAVKFKVGRLMKDRLDAANDADGASENGTTSNGTTSNGTANQTSRLTLTSASDGVRQQHRPAV